MGHHLRINNAKKITGRSFLLIRGQEVSRGVYQVACQQVRVSAVLAVYTRALIYSGGVYQQRVQEVGLQLNARHPNNGFLLVAVDNPNGLGQIDGGWFHLHDQLWSGRGGGGVVVVLGLSVTDYGVLILVLPRTRLIRMDIDWNDCPETSRYMN